MNELPARRVQVTTVVEWQGREWLMGVGFAPDGTAREVFADGVKSGQDMEALLDDSCVLMSLLLQSGETIGSIAERLGNEGEAAGDAAGGAVSGGFRAASPIGAIARRAAAIEAECGSGSRLAWAAKAAREAGA